ncbi:uncharacterized protein [Argopecten irradians]|uniref:uncharacterized protein n=1 Tax=Argopecten irradians TaxID=31199 RepID=UPI00371D5058
MTKPTGPVRQIVALYCSENGAVSLSNLLCRLKNQKLQKALPLKVCLQHFHVLEDQKLICSDMLLEWIQIEQCNLASLPKSDKTQNGISLSEKLFQITDTLQVTGK